MNSIFKKIYFFNLDLLPNYSNEQKRIQRLKIINYFLVSALLVFVINDVVLAVLKIQPYTFEKFPILIFWIISIIALWLTKKKKYLASKLIIIFTPLLFVSSYAITGYIIGEHFLWQPIVLLGLSVIPFLVLDFRTEKIWLIISFFLFLIYIIFHDRIMLAGADDHYRLIFKEINTTPFIYYAVRIIMFLFLSFIIFYSIRLNEHQQLINERINKSLLSTSDHLEAVNAEMQAQRNAINNSASLIVTDELNQIIAANKIFLAKSGYALGELKGKTVENLFLAHYDGAFIENIKKTIESGEAWKGELKIRHKDKNFFWMQTAISTIYDSNKKRKGYLSMMFDITKLKSDEERLEKLNYEKDRILYAVAHDLKNPLLNFKTLLDMIKTGSVEKDEEQEIFRILAQDCDHSIDLIGELLEIGRLEDENFVLTKDPVELNTFLDQSLRQHEQAASKKDINLIKAFDKNIGTIKINEKEFIRVIYNLISNATKFTPSGGSIKIETKHVTDNEVSIEISDSGIGISKELLPIIFDKFSKAGRRGVDGEKSTGLGMWIVKHIVGLHGGEISVMSQENKGTTFTILLPV